jgi:hypothetical protein
MQIASPRLPDSRTYTLARPAAQSLLEVLLALTVIATLTAVSGIALETLASWRGLTAIQQLVADLDEARSRALAEQREIWVAFANGDLPSEAFRSYALCEMRADSDGNKRLQPLSPWQRLSQGMVLTLTPPATSSAGRNLLLDTGALQAVRLDQAVLEMPCLGFGPLGEIIHPAAGRPLLALAEGQVRAGLPRPRQGFQHNPAQCRWLLLHRHTGNALLLP